MIDRKLFTKLVLPLVFLAVVGIVLVWPPRLEDLIYNFIVEIVSILITVIYVDWIINTREKEKWEQVDLLVKADFSSWSLKFIAETTFFLSESGVVFPESVKFKPTNEKPWGIALEHVSYEDIQSALFDSDLDDREAFLSLLKQKLGDLLGLYTRYSNRLLAEDVKAILDLEGTLRSLITNMSIIDNEADLLNLAGGDSALTDSVWTKYVEKSAYSFKELISQSILVFSKIFSFAKNKKL